MKNKQITPWVWVPTLYFAEGVPYFVVNNISVMMFTKMGVPNGDMAFFTTLLYFPWFLKGIWSPLVDVVRTKRWWIVTMQAVLTILFVLLTLTLPSPSSALIATGHTPISMFTLTLVLFIIAAFASATHDIAAVPLMTSQPTAITCWRIVRAVRPHSLASAVRSTALPQSSARVC